MLDINFIRANRQIVADDAQAKGIKVDIDGLLALDAKRRELIARTGQLRQQRNELSATKGHKPTSEQITASKSIKADLSKLETELEALEQKQKPLAQQVPNLLHESVPRGEGESANQVVKTAGDKPKFDFEPKDHETLGLELDLIDLATAAFTSGSRFYYLKNSAVTMEFALVSWLLKKLTDKGFTPVTTPVLAKAHMLEATGFFPADKNDIYHVNPDDDDLYLIGTSEVTLAGLHMRRPLDKADLPKRYAGFSTCFRREAGSYGQDTKGIFRVHQFDKIEMYSYCHPDDSWTEHDFLLGVEEEILQELGLHYRVVNIGSGDLGAAAAKKYDCEVWMPAQGRFRELTSCSNTTDFQSRRGNIKFRDDDSKLRYAHTLNGTAMASTRTLAAIFENFQTDSGHVAVPEVIRPFMGGQKTI